MEIKTSVSESERFGIIIAIVFLVVIYMSVSPPRVTTNGIDTIGLMEQFKLTSLKTSCDGIERYYSGQGFQNDLKRLTRDYNQIYDSEEGNPLGENLTLFSPRAISIGAPGYDCEDMTHATMCLGSLYPNIFCKPVLKGTDHIEAECYEAMWE